MKRGSLQRKTPLRAKSKISIGVNHTKRSKPLKRTGRKAPKAGRVEQKRRHTEAELAISFAYMAWVKGLRCLVAATAAIDMPGSGPITLCAGAVEADHAGARGGNARNPRKAMDATCIPLCTRHHRERHDFAGTFKGYDQAAMRAFLSIAIQLTQNTARLAEVEIPAC